MSFFFLTIDDIEDKIKAAFDSCNTRDDYIEDQSAPETEIMINGLTWTEVLLCIVSQFNNLFLLCLPFCRGSTHQLQTSWLFQLNMKKLTLKHAGGGGADSAHRVRIWLLFLQFLLKLLKLYFGASCLMSAFTKFFFEKLRMIGGHPFFMRRILAKKICSQKL